MLYCFSFFAVIDYFTLIPLMVRINILPEAPVFLFWRVLRIFSLMKLDKIFASKNMELTRRCFNLFFTLFATLIIIASAMGEVENDHIRKHPEDKVDQYRFHEMVYYMVVTMTTVGYGDITPETDYGRALVVLTILIMLAILPK